MKITYPLALILFLAPLQDSISSAPIEVATQPKEDTVKAVLRGRIVFDGKLPKLPLLKVTDKQSQGCKHDEPMNLADRSLLVDKLGGVANVVVTIHVEGIEPILPKEPIVLDNAGCRFEPHVVVVPLGATLKVHNSDSVPHNVHTYSKRTSPINKAIPAGRSIDLTFKRSEAISVKCDMHAWMQAWVFATDASFVALTGPDGSFSVEGLPPGEYKVKLWHERLGRDSQTITVKAGENSPVEWKMAEKKASGKRRRR